MASEQLTLNIIHDLATPHNNSLVRALRARGDLRVVTWYGQRLYSQLPWKNGLADEVDNYYYEDWINRLRLMHRILFCPREKFMVIGYAEFGTRFAFLAFWLLRRKFIYWSDHPEIKPRSYPRSLLRKIALGIIRQRARPIYGVGQHTLKSFIELGLPAEHLVDLPVFIELPALPDKRSPEILALRQKYGLQADDVLFVGASRLVFQKGYDILIDAVAQIDRSALSHFKLLIVGSGPELTKLKALVARYGLEAHIAFEGFLEPEDYERIIAAADIFVHPARFDAFGGGTLYAMAFGVPVIGSDKAGAVLERVISGENGLIYHYDDRSSLAAYLQYLLQDAEARRAMGQKARETAEQWPPSRGAEIIWTALNGNHSHE